MSIIRLDKLLKSATGSRLDNVVQSAQIMDDLTTLLRNALDPDLAQGLIAANIRENGELVLIASSSEWASRLRFESEKLMQAASTPERIVSSCKVRVSRSA